jgi:arabinogalactan oligomer/maltooligosaccharide transport system permease protein
MKILRLVVLILGTIFALYPVLLVIGTSFDARNTLVGATIIPRQPSLANYQELFADPQTPIWTWLGNSIIVSAPHCNGAGGLLPAARPAW